MSRLSKTISILILILIGMQALVSGVQAQSEKFETGNRLYNEKKYDSSVAAYESIIASGIESPSIYFNLGNAHFKTGDLGRSILNYMRARRLDPTDDDIASNLEFARQFTSIQMEGVQLNPISSMLEKITGSFRLGLMAWVSSAFYLLLLLCLAVRYGFGFASPFLKSATIIALVLVILSSGLTTFKYRNDFITRRGVILAEDTPVLTGPNSQSDIELQGVPGLIVEIIDESGDFYNVLFENKRRGWLKKDFLAVI